MADSAMTAPEASREKVQIRLSTRDPDIVIPNDPGTTLVSTSFKRLQLSTLVNSLLDTARPTPFEFLINGQFLRTTLDAFLAQNGISAEAVLNVEYIRALVPPVHVASYEHDDWVAAVDVLSGSSDANTWSAKHDVASGQERILSASYDGLLRVWDTSANCLATSTPISSSRVQSLKTAKWLSPSRVVAAGMDQVVRVYKYTDAQPGSDNDASLTPLLELLGHQWAINSLAVHAPSSRILAASQDHSIGLFSTRASEGPPPPENLLPRLSTKRQKLSADTTPPPRRGPLALLTAHTAPVSSTIFDPADPTIAYSTSHDHTLRTWDLPSQSAVSARPTSSALLSLTALPALHLLAAGTAARHITLIDPRESASTVAVMTLRGHSNAVVALAADPRSQYGLVSASHDGTCRVWDVRSVRSGGAGDVGGGQVGESVYTIERESAARKAKGNGKVVAGEGVKVFGVCWDRDVGIVSAGEDRMVQVNQGAKGMAREQGAEVS